MSFFTSNDQLQQYLTLLFEQLRQNEAAMQPLRKSKLIIRLRFTQPEAEVTVNARTTPVSVQYGAGVRPVLAIKMSADTFHNILMGNTTLTKALGQGKLDVKGPMMKALALAELFRQGQKIYPSLVD